MASVVVDGWPDVWAADIFQSSNASPGSILIDTLVSNEGVITSLPRYTTITIVSSEGTFVWENAKVVKSPRQFGRYMRAVLQDGRHVLRDIVMGQSYNLYDCNGDIYPETEKTVSELWDIITTASGLSISYIDLPSIKPQAAWRGKTLDVAINELLVSTGCRMVYRPSNQTYYVSPGDYGDVPDAVGRTYREPPFHGYSTLKVKTFPRTIEGRLACTAKVRDSAGDLVEIDPANGKLIFSNFTGILDAKERASYAQTAYRIWVPDAPEGKSLLGRRALTTGPGDDGPVYASPYVIKADARMSVPIYSHMVQLPGFNPPALSMTMCGTAFQSSHPNISVKIDGDINEAAIVLCAYHSITDGRLDRDTEEVALSGSGGDAVVFQDWIRPVESSEGEVDGYGWSSLLTSVADAIADRFRGAPQHVCYPAIIDHLGAGVVGGVRYTAMAGRRGGFQTSLAINFEPADARLL